MANHSSCSRGFSTSNATFEEFRHGAANPGAKPKENGQSGRAVLRKVGLKIGFGVPAGSSVEKTNDGGCLADYADGSMALSALPNPLGYGYTGHHQNDSVPVARYSKATGGAKDVTTAPSFKSAPYPSENFALPPAGSYCTPYYNYPGHYNFGLDPSTAVRSDYVKRHAV